MRNLSTRAPWPALLLLLALVAPATGAGTARAQDEGGADVQSDQEGQKVEVAVMKTNMGEIVLRFFPDVAPKACENFERLSKKGYYEGVTFHRVIDGFMIQGGDPLGTGYGGKSIWGVNFENEVHPDYVFDRKGILAMANAGPDTNGSQFFITLGPADWLNGGYTIFGEVVDGQDVVDEIGKVAVSPRDNKPIEPVVIEEITFEERVIGE